MALARALFSSARSTWRINPVNTPRRTNLSTVSSGITKLHSKKYSSSISSSPSDSEPSPSASNGIVQNKGVLDSLIKQLTVEVQGHDRAVIESYTKFMGMATDGFGLKHVKVIEKPKYIWRNTLLKSVHVHKKHRVQYETRNYYKTFEIQFLTGSTASTFLEYIQRNLPEGVAMKVTTETVEKFPSHLNIES